MRAAERNKPPGELHDPRCARQDESFDSPQYYSIRCGYWFEKNSDGWGVNIDFTHPKAIVDESQVVHKTGTRAGTNVNENSPIATDIQRFELSHGHLLTLNAAYRWFPKGERDDTFGLAVRF